MKLCNDEFLKGNCPDCYSNHIELMTKHQIERESLLYKQECERQEKMGLLINDLIALEIGA